MFLKSALLAGLLQVSLAIVIESISSADKPSVGSRSLSLSPKDTCVCPYDPQDQSGWSECNCPIIHGPWNDFDKRETEGINTVSVLHARSCPPDGQEVCHKVNGEVVCTPCIEERIVCPVHKGGQSESATCLRGLDGKFICPLCQPSCCPRELSRALHESNSDAWCPPCDYPQAATITEQVTDLTQPTAK